MVLEILDEMKYLGKKSDGILKIKFAFSSPQKSEIAAEDSLIIQMKLTGLKLTESSRITRRQDTWNCIWLRTVISAAFSKNLLGAFYAVSTKIIRSLIVHVA